MGRWKTFEHPTVVIAASEDMKAEREVCRRVVNDIARDVHDRQGLQAYAWKYADHPWTGEETYQHQIPRTSDPNVKAIICLFGERMGEPLPPSFELPEDLILPEWVTHPWESDGTDGKAPLTGTLFELLDALSKFPVEHHSLGTCSPLVRRRP